MAAKSLFDCLQSFDKKNLKQTDTRVTSNILISYPELNPLKFLQLASLPQPTLQIHKSVLVSVQLLPAHKNLFSLWFDLQ
jgi:hypothetical protein